jgi:hypothetical protein
MSKANVFEVIRLDGPMPWTVKHNPTGLNAGSFHYRRHAMNCAESMEETARNYPELATKADRYSANAMGALHLARCLHGAADKQQVNARKGGKK